MRFKETENRSAWWEDNRARVLGKPEPLERAWYAIVTHKGKTISELVGRDPAELEARAHRYAAGLGLKRAVVSVRPA